MDNLFIEVACEQVKKHGQYICGDVFDSTKIPEQDRIISIVSDGLGSGMKAHILASMTARMASKFVASDIDFLHGAEVIMDSLPVCQVRKISYSTFTIVDCHQNGEVSVIEMDNPSFLLVRNGVVIPTVSQSVSSEKWQERTLRFSRFTAMEDDRIIFFSDGVAQSGLGTGRFPLGWGNEGVAAFVTDAIRRNEHISAHHLAERIVYRSTRNELNSRPKDDTTCAVLYFRRPRKLLMLSGPPFDEGRDLEYARRIEEFDGVKVIAGGTTANIVSRELDLDTHIDLNQDSGGLPPWSSMKGIDLVTEGILTLTRTAQLLEADKPPRKVDAASRLYEKFVDSDIIHFLVGSRINETHQDPNLPVDIEIRLNIIRRLAGILKEKFFKEVTIERI